MELINRIVICVLFFPSIILETIINIWYVLRWIFTGKTFLNSWSPFESLLALDEESENDPHNTIKRLEKELHEKTMQYNISIAVQIQLRAKNKRQKDIIKDQHLKICKLISEKWISQDKSKQSGR